MKFLLSILFCCAFTFANETDSLFIPPKPQKPLRFCSLTKQWLEFATKDSNMVEITHMQGLKIDLRYATFNNVSGHDLYCGEERAFIRKEAFSKLKKAISLLQKKHPKFTFVIFDASRPLYAQEALRKTVRGTPYSAYVSSPTTGGLHNFGLALDLGLIDSSGALVDMGADFDSFERCAGKIGENDALKSGRLTVQQINNRNMLRAIMKESGWIELNSEWWHFNAYSSKFVRNNFSKFKI